MNEVNIWLILLVYFGIVIGLPLWLWLTRKPIFYDHTGCKKYIRDLKRKYGIDGYE